MANTIDSSSNNKANTNPTQQYDVKYLRIILMGGTGKGKSSVGNSILRREYFEYGCEADSLTSECSTGSYSTYLDDEMKQELKISVTDTPGLCDTRQNNDTITQLIGRQIFELTAPGPNCILIVCSIVRFTDHEGEIIELIKAMFGPNAVKYCMFIFTHEDQLRKGETIQKWIKKSNRVRHLMEQYQNRYMSINNNNVTEEKRNELINKINEMIRENGKEYYTNTEYQRIELIRRFKKEKEAQKEESKRLEAEQIRQENADLKQKLANQRIQQENHETQSKQQSTTEKILFEVGTKVLCALTEIGTHAGKAYTDNYFKNKKQPIQQSAQVSFVTKTESASPQSVIDDTLKTLPSAPTVCNSKSEEIEITSVRARTSSVTENPISEESDSTSRCTTTSCPSPSDPIRCRTLQMPIETSRPSEWLSEFNRQHNLLSEIKLDPVTSSLLKNIGNLKLHEYSSKS